jgi:hypothetical protein
MPTKTKPKLKDRLYTVIIKLKSGDQCIQVRETSAAQAVRLAVFATVSFDDVRLTAIERRDLNGAKSRKDRTGLWKIMAVEGKRTVLYGYIVETVDETRKKTDDLFA